MWLGNGPWGWVTGALKPPQLEGKTTSKLPFPWDVGEMWVERLLGERSCCSSSWGQRADNTLGCAGLLRGREGMEVLIGRMWVRTAPLLPPWATNLLQLPTWNSTGLILLTAKMGWKRVFLHGRCVVGTGCWWRCWRGTAVWATMLPVGKRWVERARCDFFGWLARRGSYCQVDFTGLETWDLKNVYISSRQRCTLESWKLFHCWLWEEILAF